MRAQVIEECYVIVMWPRTNNPYFMLRDGVPALFCSHSSGMKYALDHAGHSNWVVKRVVISEVMRKGGA